MRTQKHSQDEQYLGFGKTNKISYLPQFGRPLKWPIMAYFRSFWSILA